MAVEECAYFVNFIEWSVFLKSIQLHWLHRVKAKHQLQNPQTVLGSNLQFDGCLLQFVLNVKVGSATWNPGYHWSHYIVQPTLHISGIKGLRKAIRTGKRNQTQESWMQGKCWSIRFGSTTAGIRKILLLCLASQWTVSYYLEHRNFLKLWEIVIETATQTCTATWVICTRNYRTDKGYSPSVFFLLC